MKRLILLSFVLLMGYSSLLAQHNIGVRSLAFLGITNNLNQGYFYNGGGLELYYKEDLKNAELRVGGRYRMIHWGNQLTATLGYNYIVWQQDAWKLTLNVHTEAGLALFYPRPLFVMGFGVLPEIQWQSKKRFYASFAFGAGLVSCLAYEKYSRAHTVIEIPIKLGIGFRIGKMNN